MKIIGHRGARGLAPENTIASLEKALEVGVDGIEIDVRVTKDGQAILLHNRNVVNASGVRYASAQYTLDELRAVKSDIPLLADAIKAVGRRVPLMIEVKRNEKTAPIVKVIQEFLERGWQTSDFSVASFSQKTLVALHKALPGVTPIVLGHFWGARAMWRANRVGTKHISMSCQVVWFGYVRAMKRRGYQLYTFTVNDPKKARGWQKYGLEGVITDRPDLFAKDR